ncbi:flagellar motor switch protein FliN [Methyloversatilis sp.]|uniref:flagellar motor switch protein FliN n=1 Tax=Methyloversatilis sp. TaxID=2569862 RepID=UPI0035B271D2
MSEAAAAEEQVSEDDWAAAMAEQTTADEALAELDAGKVPVAQPANIFQQFGESANKPDEGLRDFEMILDIPVQLTVELGRTKISIRNLLQLGHGSVVELDGMAGEPMDVLVNGTLIAQGEVVVVNDKFGIRLTDIITPAERMKKLKR